MMRYVILILFGLVSVLATQSAALAQAPEKTISEKTIIVRLDTNMGVIDIALDPQKAPLTVENFLAYARAGYYDRMVFHRIVPGVLIQTGGYNRYLFERGKLEPVKNESDNGLKNRRGSVAMARYEEPDSARSQFFINLADNPQLDYVPAEYAPKWGYTVFGHVVAGMDVADAIGAVETVERDDFKEYPAEAILLNSVEILNPEKMSETE